MSLLQENIDKINTDLPYTPVHVIQFNYPLI